MSFGKAKRFIYKEPELSPSPADYAITTTLEKGCKISEAPRFRTPTKQEESSSSCSRTSSSCSSFRSSTPKSEKEYNMGCDFNLLKEKIVELNRNDIKRQSIRKKSLEIKEKPKVSNPNSFEYYNNRGDINRRSFRKKPAEVNEKPKSNTFKYDNNVNDQHTQKFYLHDALKDHTYYSFRSKSLETDEKRNMSDSNSFEYSNNADQDFGQFYLSGRTALVDHDYCLRRKSYETNVNSKLSNSNLFEYDSDVDQKLHFHLSEEFIDDDFTSLTSSEQADYKKPVETHAFEKLYDDFERMQINTKKESDSLMPAVQDLLGNIDKKIENVKSDVTKLHKCFNGNVTKKIDGQNKSFKKKVCVPESNKNEEINNIIKRTIQFLRNQFEMHGKSLKEETEESVRSFFNDIFVTTEKSTEQIIVFCCNAANHLSKHINKTLNTTIFSGMESSSDTEDFAIENLTTQNDDDYDVENYDELDFTLKFGDSHETLSLQESILDALKHELADLKESFQKVK